MAQGGDMQSLRIYPPANMKRPLVRALLAAEVLSFVFIVWTLIPSQMTVKRAMADLRKRDTPVRQVWAALGEKFPFLGIDVRPLPEIHLNAIQYLQTKSTNAAPAIPLLIEKLGDTGSIPLTASIALARVGPQAVPALLDALDSTRSQIRAFAAYALLQINPDDPATLLHLSHHANDHDVRVRRAMFRILNRHEIAVHQSTNRFLQALDDKDAEVRVLAAIGLVNIGQTSEAVLPALLTGKHYAHQLELIIHWDYYTFGVAPNMAPICPLDSVDPQTWRFAVQTFERMKPSDNARLAALKALLQAEEAGLAIAAAGAIWRKTRNAELILPTLINLIERKEPFFGDYPFILLREMGPAAKPAIPALLSIANSSTNALANYARSALDKINEPPADAKYSTTVDGSTTYTISIGFPGWEE
ncbi:MAG: HEAT repeat domain-containing protein [Verrucomicrobiota bacterium]